jgi:hypothetical protein
VELQLKEIEQNRQVIASRLQYEQAQRFDLFYDATGVSLDRITAEIVRDRPANGERSASQQKVLDEIVGFWEKAIAADLDRSGKPGFRSADYRSQMALCLARAGDHKRAFEAVGSLLSDQERSGRQAPWLVRICALCASAADSDPRLAQSYIAEGIQVLRRAAGSPSAEPPSAGDPDLAALAGQPEFESLLNQWRQKWSQLIEPHGSQIRPVSSIPLESPERN